jgi:hypothetical protein
VACGDLRGLPFVLAKRLEINAEETKSGEAWNRRGDSGRGGRGGVIIIVFGPQGASVFLASLKLNLTVQYSTVQYSTVYSTVVYSTGTVS